MLALLGIGHAAHVAPVVVTQQDEHVVGHTHALVVVVEHLLVECPHLRRLLGGTARHLLDDLTLVLDDALQQLRVGILAHGLVAVATHTDGHDVVSTLHALDALAEELVELRLVLLIVPGAPLATAAGILLMVAGHGLVVTGAHDDAHLVGRLRVQRVVGIECPAPHGGPEEIALEAQDQLKDFLVEAVVAIAGAEGVLHPRGQTRRLVVEEQAAIAHGRLAVRILTLFNIEGVVVSHGNIGPPVPWRHAHLARQLIDAKHGAALVAAGNDQLLADGLDDVLLGLALQVAQLAALHPLVNLAVAAHRTNEDVRRLAKGRLFARHALDVRQQTGHRPLHATVLTAVIADSSTLQGERVSRRLEDYELLGSLHRHRRQ